MFNTSYGTRNIWVAPCLDMSHVWNPRCDMFASKNMAYVALYMDMSGSLSMAYMAVYMWYICHQKYGICGILNETLVEPKHSMYTCDMCGPPASATSPCTKLLEIFYHSLFLNNNILLVLCQGAQSFVKIGIKAARYCSFVNDLIAIYVYLSIFCWLQLFVPSLVM